MLESFEQTSRHRDISQTLDIYALWPYMSLTNFPLVFDVMADDERVVVLIDMDCFFCQVEEKLNPDLKGKPIAVVQYNPWQGGG